MRDGYKLHTGRHRVCHDRRRGRRGASSRNGDGWRRTFWEALIAVIAAAAVAEHFLPPSRVWLCCGAGVAVGLVIGYVLDSVQAVAPSTVRGLLEKLAGSIAKTDKADK